MLGLLPRAAAPGTAQTPLFEDRFVCVVRRGHARVRGKLTLATYVKLPHVLVSHQPNGRGVVDDVLAQRGLTRTVVLRVSHFLLVPAIIAATDYVAALSEFVARPFAKTWPLQLLPPPLAAAGRHGAADLAREHARVAGPGLAARRRSSRWRAVDAACARLPCKSAPGVHRRRHPRRRAPAWLGAAGADTAGR